MASSEDSASCFFNCSNASNKLLTASRTRIETIIASSKRRGDGLHEKLTNSQSILCHKNCVSTYTSEHHIKRHEQLDKLSAPPAKKTRRSDTGDFYFKKHCIFCGSQCEQLDSRHPQRWRKVIQCRTADRGKDCMPFKQNILLVCDQRNDLIADDVRLRVQGAVSDLHAADAQYHLDCYNAFMSPRAIEAATKPSETSEDVDTAFFQVVEGMEQGMDHLWNSLDLLGMYNSFGGHKLSRRHLVECVTKHFGPELIKFSGNGYASLLVFKRHAPHILKAVEDTDEEIPEVKYIVKCIKQDAKKLEKSDNTYTTRISKEIAGEAVSPTMANLLAAISPKLVDSNQALLIGNIVTSCVTNKATSLQIALGVLLREKQLIDECHAFGICASYDEILRFKTSAAHASSHKAELRGLFNSNSGLIQAVADNYDANVSSPNCLRSTHSLALLLTQMTVDGTSEIEEHPPTVPVIRRISKAEMKEHIVPPISVHRYHGPKKPDMPEDRCNRTIPPLAVLASQSVSLSRAHDIDHHFLREVVDDPSCTPEFNGFNVSLARNQGHSAKPATTAIYTPLIDMTPSDPDTIMSAMLEAQRLTNKCGQAITVFTNDQQLYRVAVNVTWVYPQLFTNFVLRLGGMHFLMSFVGAVGTLMSNTGLTEIMQTTFGGVPKMLTGKKFPQNMRALRMVVEELLRSIVVTTDNYQQLLSILDDKASQSRTAKLWIDNLIKPVLLMMVFVRAEREADWPLHLWAVAEMIPYFFASSHCNYARYGLYYLRSMEHLPDDLLPEFLMGKHVMRHNPGIWNGIWSDMFIESTFMRYGHESGGLTGLTLKPSAVTRWALSLHICSQIRGDLVAMKDKQHNKIVKTHKEEAKGMIASDKSDRQKIHDALQSYIDPLATDTHPPGILNIVTGLHAMDKVNVEESLKLGREQMVEFEAGWPTSFNKTLTKKVTMMTSTKKSIKLDGKPVYDTELIYTRAICLQQYRDIDITDVLSYELSPVPASLFDESGAMRAQSKAVLKTKLQVEQSSRIQGVPNAVIIDGCAMLWTVHWPANGTVEDYLINFMGTIKYHLELCDVYLIFDRYINTSTKQMTRSSRSGHDGSRKHQLDLHTTLPAQKVVLNIAYNKIQLIDLVCQYLMSHIMNNHTKLVITGKDPIPIQVWNNSTLQRPDLKTNHEEADVIIIHHLVRIASGASGDSHIKVVCDDTDVFVLLIHFYLVENMTVNVSMESPCAGRTIVDIRQTALKHKSITKYLPAVHALTGCDTVSYLFGIGKVTALKVLMGGHHLNLLGQLGADEENLILEATAFIAACYGSKVEGNMTTHRYELWKSKMANSKITSAPKLKSLPPSHDAFVQHVHRAQHQVIIWKSATQSDPPDLDPIQYGWQIGEDGTMLYPTTLPVGVSAAPATILQLIKCGCSTSRPCSTGRCGCVAAQMSCSMFCRCNAGSECCNEQTRAVANNQDDDDDH